MSPNELETARRSADAPSARAAGAANGQLDILGRPRPVGERASAPPGTPAGTTLLTALRVLRRRLALILMCLLVVPAAALAYSLSQPERYSAEAKLHFRDPGIDESLFGGQVLGGSDDSSRAAATNERLVGLTEVAGRTAKQVGRGLTAGAVKRSLDVSAEGESDIVSITAEYTDPHVAASIANTHAREFIRFRRDADRSKIREAQGLLERRLQRLTPTEARSDRGRVLENRLEELESLAAVQTGNAELVQTAAIPERPSSPKISRNTVAGAVLGLMLGIGLAFLAENLDRRLKEREDVEQAFALPILGTIPQSRAIAQGKRDIPRDVEAEAFRRLRTNLRYFNVDRQIHTLLITSAAPGEGKTTVAWNLAVAAARTGEQVLYIEADLRRPALSRYLDTRVRPGLSSLLAGVAHFDDVLFSAPLIEVSEGDEALAPVVDVISAGLTPPNPAELIDSDRMRRLIRQVEDLYDLVVIDTPPTSRVSDAIPLITQVNGVVIVSQLGRSRRDDAEALRELLRYLNAPALGVVLNGHASKSDYYGY